VIRDAETARRAIELARQANKLDFRTDVFDEYTPEARRSVFFAHATARQLSSEAVEGVHLLLGIARENIELLNRFLSPSLSESTLQNEITNGVSTSGAALQRVADIPDIPFSGEGKRVFSLAAEEATRMSQQRVGIEHLLLGLLREQNSVAARMLQERGADVDRIREQLLTHPHQAPPKEERMRREIEKIHKIMADAPRLGPDRSREEVFGRYTVRADRLIFFARHFATCVGSPVVESEHILIAIVREGRDHFELFFPFADSKDTVYKKLEEHLTPSGTIDLSVKIVATKELPLLSARCKRVLSFADEEATILRSEHIAPEHLLLGMLREKDSYAAVLLREYGAELERIRKGLAA
jgi:ATP-dependent Clp protease ATP-binding subunit ClpA